LEAGDFVAISEGVALAGTWFWVLRRKVDRIGMRRRLATYAFGTASMSVVFDLILTVILHFHQNPDDAVAGLAYVVLFPLGIVTALAGLVLGLVAKGVPRIAAIAWSLVMLATGAVTVFLIAKSL
jgi:hypothetical protein